MEEVAEAAGGGYCRLQMPFKLALAVREAVVGHRLGALEGGGGLPTPPLKGALPNPRRPAPCALRQSEFKRIMQAHKLGFRHMLFDDNWSPLQGDNYSAKQVCDETGGLALRQPDFPSKVVRRRAVPA